MKSNSTLQANLTNRKMFIVLLAAFALLSLQSCNKEDINPSSGSGRVTFWTNISSGWSNIDIMVKGEFIGSLTQYHTSTPDCENAINGVVSVVKPAGTYNYTAQSNSGTSWSGTITFDAGGCTTMNLTGTGGNNGNNGNNGCGYSLNGTWHRQSGGISGCEGAVINFNGNSGTYSSSPSGCCFPVGDLYWKNYNPNDCTISVHIRNTGDCSDQGYENESITFIDQNTVTVGSVTWTR